MFDRAGLVALVLVTASLAGCVNPLASNAEEVRSGAEEAARELDSPDAAREAGYEPETFCTPDEGVHWVNEDLLDDELDPSEPEAVLFLPTTESVESTFPDDQRFLGVAYMAPVAEDEPAPTVAGVPLEGPKPGLSASMPSFGELHVYLDEQLADETDADDPFPEKVFGIDCPQGTVPPSAYDEPSGSPGEPASCSEVFTGERTHEHARVEVYLGSEELYDFSAERYQLADRRLHFEAGERDAGGAIAHVHEAGATLGCLLETMGWDVSGDRLITDTGVTYESTPEAPFEVFVDGEPSRRGFDEPLEDGRTYVLRHDSQAPPRPCPGVGNQDVHEHAQLEVSLNGSEPFDFSAERYQNQADFVAFEDGEADRDGARIHVNRARPTLSCLFATLGWETADHRIETDEQVYEATNGTGIEVLVNGEPAEQGFDEPIRNANTYEVRYNASNASSG
jgi:hypothetical protein